MFGDRYTYERLEICLVAGNIVKDKTLVSYVLNTHGSICYHTSFGGVRDMAS